MNTALKVTPPDDGAPLPWVVTPPTAADTGIDALVAFGTAERTAIDDLLHTHGALLLRGFDVSTAEDFERVSTAFGPPLAHYVGGDSPRRPRSASGKVYTSTEYPADQEVFLHNEMSYAPWWPRRVYFWCRVAAKSGGSTHLADSRRILAALPRELVERFATLGVTYLSTLPHTAGARVAHKTWQQTYETDDRKVVERWCREREVDIEWTAHGLRTRVVRPGVITHPVTGERVWFNQADQYHAASGSVLQQGLPTDLPLDDYPTHALYGDGSPIAAEDIAAIRAATRTCEVVRPWQAREVLVLDNVLTAHGRKPFTGPREVLVSMA